MFSKSLLATLFLVFSLFSSARPDTCEIYNSPKIWQNFNRTFFLPTSEPWPQDVTQCPRISNSDENCCSTEFWIEIEKIYQTQRSNVREARIQFDNLVQPYLNLNVDQIWNQLPPETQQFISKDTFRKIFDKIKEFYKNFGRSYERCLGGILKYWVGMVCLACSPNAANTYVTQKSLNYYQVNLHSMTCDNVWDGCNDLYEFSLELASIFEPTQNFNNYCEQTDCKKNFCDSMFLGTDIQYDGFSGFIGKRMNVARKVSEVTVENVYSNNGYDAVKYGSESSLTATGSFLTFSMFLFLAVFGVVFGVCF